MGFNDRNSRGGGSRGGGFRSGGGGFRGGGGGFRGGGFRNDGPREMHKATCAACGKECEVPFKPTEGRPVYCRDCFMKQKGTTSSSPSPRKKPEEDSDKEESEGESEDEASEED